MSSPLRILHVDGNAQDRSLVADALGREFPGLHLEQIAGQEGLNRALMNGGFDLVITDHGAGQLDGLQVLQAAKARWPQCSVIVFTGAGSEEFAVEAMKAGLDDYVVKSARPAPRLARAVRSTLKKTEAEMDRNIDELASLYRASTQLIALGGDVPNLARQIVHAVHKEFSFDYCGILLFNSDKTALEVLASIGAPGSAPTTLPLNGPGLVAAAARAGEMIYAPDVTAAPHYLPGDPAIRSELAIPLCIGEKVIGVLNLESPELEAFDERARRVMAAFAGSAALALRNAQLYTSVQRELGERRRIEEALRRQNEYQTALYETTLGLMNRLEMWDLLEAILARAAQLMNTENGFIYLSSGNKDEIEVKFAIGVHAGHIGRRMKLGEGLAGKVWQSGQPLILDDYAAWPEHPSEFVENGLHSIVGWPLKSGAQVVGVLGVSHLEEGRNFSNSEIEILERFAQLASIVLDNARLFQEADRHLKQLQSLRKIDMTITASLDLRTTLDAILDQVATHFTVDAADILLLNSQTQTLEYAAARGFRTAALQHTRLQLGEGYAGRAALQQSVVNIPNLLEAVGDLERAPLLAEEGFVTYYSVPLIAKGQLEGVLEIFHRTPLDLEGKMMDSFLQALAAQAAIAIDNATLFDSLQRSINALRDAQMHLVRAARLTAVGELAAGVAHQINNPLTTVIADAQLLLKFVSPDSPAYASAAAIFQAGWRAQRVVQRLLNFSRPDDDQYAPADINASIVEALDLVGAHLTRGGVDLQVTLAPDLPQTPANSHQLEEIWINLLMNARDALIDDRPGIITLTSRVGQNGGAVEVEISDNGRGIPEADRMNIFTPFFTTKGRERGNGLGLSVCQSIVQNHQGEISFESRAGQGTTFHIRLPLARKM
ncbi:MAG: GAF domain-containing protein [Chloroflexi bacterium]|nr:GAF domain-containing protein [Chloroflexota bacterium]